MTRPDPTKIIVPRQHGEVLFEPSPEALLPAVSSRLAATAEREGIQALFGMPDSKLRALARRTMLDAVREHAAAIGQPPPDIFGDRALLLTGHQVEFYHAGVWAKVVAVDELARRAGKGAVAIDLLVDHDTVDRMGFDLPVQSPDGAWKREPLTFAPPSAVPAMYLHTPPAETFEQWDAAIARHPMSHTDALAHFMADLRPDTPSYVLWMSRARTRLERSMNLQVHHVPASTAIAGPAWNTFMQAWCTAAERLTALYNKHLAAYRHRQGIKSTHHPMPDLDRQPHQWEIPFWACTPGQPRERLSVHRAGEQTTLLVGGQRYPLGPQGQLPADLPFTIRPRALTLTMYTRLFLADLFIHGIGGALYDQITDGILDELFGTVPPYGCVSAAWLLPLGQAIEPEDIPALRHRRHHAQHNPQLVIDPFTALRTEVAERIRDRKQLVAQIAESLATARRDPAARQQRRDWFDQLHALNADLHKRAPRLLANLDHQIDSALRAAAENKTLLWREYFFPLHTLESLQKLIAAVRDP